MRLQLRRQHAYWMTVNYREAYGLFACNGILFNHESPLRGETFVTRKITLALSRIKLGLQQNLRLGNLDARRDWGHARDYVEMQWIMLQQPEPEDYVIATGTQRSVRDFVDAAARVLDMPIHWEGEGVDEKGIGAETLLGDASKAHQKLGWKPKTTFEELVEEMVLSDYAAIELSMRSNLVRSSPMSASPRNAKLGALGRV